MLPKYVVIKEIGTPEKKILLIPLEKYNAYEHEPIDGSDDREEAENILKKVQEMGVLEYLKTALKKPKK